MVVILLRCKEDDYIEMPSFWSPAWLITYLSLSTAKKKLHIEAPLPIRTTISKYLNSYDKVSSTLLKNIPTDPSGMQGKANDSLPPMLPQSCHRQ